MKSLPIHRRTSRSLGRVARSPLALSLGVLPLGVLVARAAPATKAAPSTKTASATQDALFAKALSALKPAPAIQVVTATKTAPATKAAPKGQPHVRLAQTRQEDRNAPAAAPDDRPRGLQLPTGPTLGLPSTTPGTEGQNNSTVLSPGATPSGGGAADAPTIIGNVTEAEGREIAEVHAVGNRIVTADAILAQVRTQRGAAFSSRQVELDRTRIEALGFFALVQAQVAPNVSDPQKVDVTYIVTENRVVTGFSFAGNTVIKSAELQKVLTSKAGAVLNRATVATDVAAIQKAYSNKGFAVLVQSATQLDNGQIAFTLLEARLTNIKLQGLTKTKPSLVRRLISTPLGLPFDASKLRRDLSRIYDTGFFEDATFRIDDDPDTPGSVTATFLLKEKRSGSFNVGVGFDSRSKISGFLSVGENNFRGVGQRVAASVEAGSQRNYELSFGNPFVGKRLGSYDLSIYQRTLFRDPRIFQNLNPGLVTTTTFAEQRQGARVNFSQPIDAERNTTVLLGYRNEHASLKTTDINGSTVNPPLINGVLFTGSGTVSAASIGLLRDKRDSRLEPSRGGRELLTIEQGFKLLGGSTSFTKLDIDLRRYLPLSKAKSATELPKIVLAGRVVFGRSLNQLPAFEQYFIGGPDTVRGYNSDIQFGDNQAYGNIELRYRLNRQIQGVLFSDAGSSFGGQFTSNKNADVLTSVGVGARLQTPIGPVRLDYGFGRNGARFQFGIGPTF